MTIRLAWVTDPHFDHATVGALTEHVAEVHAAAPDAVLVTGDFATAGTLPRWIRAYRRMVDRPLYFVLGNHDFWGSAVAPVREGMRRFGSAAGGLVYLTTAGPQTLAEGLALVGHDGWYDARAGRWEEPRFRMQDWARIADYAGAGGHGDIVATSRALAEMAEGELVPQVEAAARTHTTVLVATHVPPWPLPPGEQRHPDGMWIAPWYVAQRLGQALEQVAAAHPDVGFRVLSGHAHVRREGMAIAPNLTCEVGGARYGRPGIAGLLELG